MTALQTQIADMITALEKMDTEDHQYEALCDAIDALGVLKQSFVDEYGKPFIDEYGCSYSEARPEQDTWKQRKEDEEFWK